jgi:branched-subunit amino acid aminotransferase/4-amino-4-deoxychorismate lyase
LEQQAELKETADDGRLLEAFGAGTATVVTPIECIQYQGKDVEIPAVGSVTKRIWDEITNFQYMERNQVLLDGVSLHNPFCSIPLE